MALILSIESSGNICSVALHTDGTLLALVESDEPNVHGQKLALFVQEILDLQKLKIKDLDAIAVSEGPGSYTGLRIGVSLAKGICYASGIPLIAVNTLQSLAKGALTTSSIKFSEHALLMPMVDARRMEVYTAVFNQNLNELISSQPVILDELFYDSLSPMTYAFGNGSNKIEPGKNSEKLIVIPDINFSAKYIGEIAHEIYLKQQFSDLAYFEPVYLKEFAVLLKK